MADQEEDGGDGRHMKIDLAIPKYVDERGVDDQQNSAFQCLSRIAFVLKIPTSDFLDVDRERNTYAHVDLNAEKSALIANFDMMTRDQQIMILNISDNLLANRKV